MNGAGCMLCWPHGWLCKFLGALNKNAHGETAWKSVQLLRSFNIIYCIFCLIGIDLHRYCTYTCTYIIYMIYVNLYCKYFPGMIKISIWITHSHMTYELPQKTNSSQLNKDGIPPKKANFIDSNHRFSAVKLVVSFREGNLKWLERKTINFESRSS